ncbi:PIN domain-containing protein [Pedobacter petrophilus]|uniref:PIN domain-containing protein n=1 Tax=Pedobacter petrophilus TaxID=1908241 RepID=A0A7K0FX15_9SPHI|nr:type II toxin-antitoxin system VapC family toxin [Pedobacter petrophilus]MRX76157.1 PIN domain-containing protein [Pedobacter petrophilus]
MEINYLWDTNTVIYYLQGLLSEDAEKLIDNILLTTQPAISAITEIELLCWRTAGENDLKLLRNFIGDSYVYELNREIKDQTAELRKHHNLKLPDAIIAATALVNKLTLITRNVKDFDKISNLHLSNPF